MIVYDLDSVCIALMPAEANAPLSIDPNAVLAFAIATQRLQLIRGRDTQCAQICGGVDHPQFAHRNPLNVVRQFPRELPTVNPLRLSALKRLDHEPILTPGAIIVKRYSHPGERPASGFDAERR